MDTNNNKKKRRDVCPRCLQYVDDGARRIAKALRLVRRGMRLSDAARKAGVQRQVLNYHTPKLDR